VCLELQEKANEDPTFTHISRIITGDESWIYGYDPETNNSRCSGRSHNHQEQKRRGRSGVEQRAWSLFSSMWRGLFTVNLFLLTLRSILTFTVRFWDAWEKICEQNLELLHNHNWLLHHDNVPAHTSLKTTESVTNNNMVIVPHPPYSLDWAPCDLTLFPKLKLKLKEQCIKTVSDIQRQSQAVLNSIKENDFHGCSKLWKMMGSLYTFQRRLFWRRSQPKLSKLSQHFFFT
jgi:hypothetical protein